MGLLAPTDGAGGGGGAGDVVGPASSTDNAAARFDSTTGKLLQDGPVTISDAGAVAGVTTINSTTIPSSKTLVVTTDKISVLAATTSAELAGVISDESGTGALVFANTPTLVTPILGTPTSGTLTNCTAPASIITSGTLVHERGGLEADVSAYSGLVGIDNGTTYQTGFSSAYFIPYGASATEQGYYFLGAQGGTNPGAAVLVASRLYTWPFVAPANLSVIRDLHFYVDTGVAATNARFGIYETDASTGLPGALVANTDSGNLSTATSATLRTFTPGATVRLKHGLQYWVALHCDGAPTLFGLNGLTSNCLPSSTTINTSMAMYNFYTGKALGAMDDPYGTAARTYETVSGAARHTGMVLVRWSS